MFREITIIGGAGHVGLAFALICAKKNIKVGMSLSASGYRAIDQDGKEHKLADDAELLAYYKQQFKFP